MSELHLIVLWSNARRREADIVEDVRRQFALLRSCEVEWPAAPAACFKKFYGVKLDSAEDKAESAGAGPFRLLLVRDDEPEYALQETSRGIERVNVRLFACKQRYREWTGGGHSVHTTNSEAETRHDVLLLTGHDLESWRASDALKLEPFPGLCGWPDVRTLFAFLNETLEYVVLRNWESLPSAFDPSVHGDIDLLVADVENCATLLGATKVYDEPHRVHYSVQVGGREVRFDFRHVGDDYYDEAWERAILAHRRKLPEGFYVPSPEDAFYMLVYHALFQKPSVASDYPDKCRALAAEIGLDDDFDGYLPKLDAFLKSKDYAVVKPRDASVYRNRLLIRWKALVARVCAIYPMDGVRPFAVADWPDLDERMTDFFLSGAKDGRRVVVKYASEAAPTLANEYAQAKKLHDRYPDVCAEPLFWHDVGEDRFLVQEFVEGVSLDRFLAQKPSEAALEAVARSLADAVRRMNELKILHRDLRPANVIVCADNTVRLIDFQFAIDLTGGFRESFYLRSNPLVLMSVGADFRAGDELFCDAVSLQKCLALFPSTAAIDALCADVTRWAEGDALRLEVVRETWWARRCRRRRQRYEKYGVNGFWGYVCAKVLRACGMRH